MDFSFNYIYILLKILQNRKKLIKNRKIDIKKRYIKK